MRIGIDNISENELFEILRGSSQDFDPPLDEAIDIKFYANKWSSLARIITAREKNQVIGIIVFYLNKEYSFIPHLWVDAAFQRRGIGQALIDELINEVENKTDCLMLEAVKTNEKALSFYHKNGFCILSDRDEKYTLVKNLRRIDFVI